MCFFFTPFLPWCYVFLGGMFCVTATLEDPFMTHAWCSGWGKEFLIQGFTVHDPSVWWNHILLAEKQPQSIIFPPLCLTVGIEDGHLIFLAFSSIAPAVVFSLSFLLRIFYPHLSQCGLSRSTILSVMSFGSFSVLPMAVERSEKKKLLLCALMRWNQEQCWLLAMSHMGSQPVCVSQNSYWVVGNQILLSLNDMDISL